MAKESFLNLKRRKALTLFEILISMIILALVLSGLMHVFVSGKRLILHSRSRMTASELAKYSLEPMYFEVRQDQWVAASNDYSSENKLSKGTNKIDDPQAMDSVDYSVSYNVGVPPGFAANDQMRKVKLSINWEELEAQ